MANPEQLAILKKGVEVWNKWRRKNITFSVDLTQSDLGGGVLNGANLARANLNGASLRGAVLMRANLNNATLFRADVREVTLNSASIIGAGFNAADVRKAKLIGADLRKANLTAAKLQAVNLTNANLGRAHLIGADLTNAILDNVDFDLAELGGTVFGNVNLTNVSGLESARHRYFSIISPTTMQLSGGNIPLTFMRGCGLSDWEIEGVRLYNPHLSNDEVNEILYRMYDLRASQALQISPLFISYSHVDSKFVDKIGDHLTEKGIRYWRDTHEMKAGRMEKQIDRAIRQNPTVLLILSKHSLSSDWVELEVRTARELEKEIGRDLLCPVALDDSWKDSSWPKRIMEQIMEYNILDFSAWKDDSKFEGMFRKLIDGLKLFYKG